MHIGQTPITIMSDSESSDDSSGFLEITDTSMSYEQPEAPRHNYTDLLPPPCPLLPKSLLTDEYPRSHLDLL